MSEETKESVVLCPECSFPLFTDSLGAIPEDISMTCGLCSWQGKATEARVLPIPVWREYLFNPKSTLAISPIPRRAFYVTLAEKVASLVPDFGTFLTKWGVISVSDLQSPRLKKIFNIASRVFIRVVSDGLTFPETVEKFSDYGLEEHEVSQEPEQLELPLEVKPLSISGE